MNQNDIVGSSDKSGIDEKDRIIFDLINDRYKHEFEILNKLDTKATSLIGFTGLIIGLVGTIIPPLVSALPSNQALNAYYLSYKVIINMGIISLFLSILFCLMAYYMKTISLVPDSKELIRQYGESEESASITLNTTAKMMAYAIDKNYVHQQNKVKFIKIGFYLFGFGVFMVTIFMVGLLMV